MKIKLFIILLLVIFGLSNFFVSAESSRRLDVFVSVAEQVEEGDIVEIIKGEFESQEAEVISVNNRRLLLCIIKSLFEFSSLVAH